MKLALINPSEDGTNTALPNLAIPSLAIAAGMVQKGRDCTLVYQDRDSDGPAAQWKNAPWPFSVHCADPGTSAAELMETWLGDDGPADLLLTIQSINLSDAARLLTKVEVVLIAYSGIPSEDWRAAAVWQWLEDWRHITRKKQNFPVLLPVNADPILTVDEASAAVRHIARRMARRGLTELARIMPPSFPVTSQSANDAAYGRPPAELPEEIITAGERVLWYIGILPLHGHDVDVETAGIIWHWVADKVRADTLAEGRLGRSYSQADAEPERQRTP